MDEYLQSTQFEEKENEYKKNLEHLENEYKKKMNMATSSNQQLQLRREHEEKKDQIESVYQQFLKPAMEKLQQVQDDIYQCSICKQRLGCDDKPIKLLDCGHEFDVQCIEAWFEVVWRRSRTKPCPLCQHDCSMGASKCKFRIMKAHGKYILTSN